MRIKYLKLRNIAHSMFFEFFTSFKGTNFHILFNANKHGLNHSRLSNNFIFYFTL